jgi:ABC transporter substrate binding protein
MRKSERTLCRLRPLSRVISVNELALLLQPLQQETRSIPIVFTQISDPVGSGFVASLSHPGGNVTGFTPAEFSMYGKSLEVLKEAAPHVTRVAVILNPEQKPQAGMPYNRLVELRFPEKQRKFDGLAAIFPIAVAHVELIELVDHLGEQRGARNLEAGVAHVTRIGRALSVEVRRPDRLVRKHPVGGAVAWGRAAPNRYARPRRDRARCLCIRRRAKWRPDRSVGRAGAPAPQSDRHTGSPAQASSSLLRPSLRRRRP